MNLKEKLKNLKVGDKLRKSYKTIILAIIVMSIVAFVGIMVINLRINSFYNEAYKNMQIQLEIKEGIQSIAKNVAWAVNCTKEEIPDKITAIEEISEMVEEKAKELEGNFSDKALTEELHSAIKDVKVARIEVVNRVRAGLNVQQFNKEEALKYLNGNFAEATELMNDVLNRIGEVTESEASSAYTFTMILGIVVVVVVVLSGIATIVVSLRYSKTITSLIVAPIEEIQSAARMLKEGQLDIEIEYDSEDELGALAGDFRQACVRMKAVIEDVGYLLSEMAEGNFNVKSSAEESYVGNFKLLIASTKKLNRDLDKTLRQINEASSGISMGAEQLSFSAQELADGSTDQAGAVEELTATIENVASIASESADSAEIAANNAMETAEEAKKSRKEMDELVRAMERITSTSKEIEKIIATIEEIASQTELLSLNASIEAARAGEAGRGFAVVAQQVGKLATDSAASAELTKTLIEKSLDEINKGNELAYNTMNTISTVLVSIDNLAAMAAGSAEASKAQATMLGEIELGIEQISVVVENNSASAQETAAISQGLSAQAESFKTMVEEFQLRDENDDDDFLDKYEIEIDEDDEICENPTDNPKSTDMSIEDISECDGIIDDVDNESSEQVPEDVDSESSEQASEDVDSELSEQVPEDVDSESSEQPSKDVDSESSEQASEDVDSESSEQVSEDVNTELLEPASEDTVCELSDGVLEDKVCEMSDNAESDDTMCEVPHEMLDAVIPEVTDETLKDTALEVSNQVVDNKFSETEPIGEAVQIKKRRFRRGNRDSRGKRSKTEDSK